MYTFAASLLNVYLFENFMKRFITFFHIPEQIRVFVRINIVDVCLQNRKLKHSSCYYVMLEYYIGRDTYGLRNINRNRKIWLVQRYGISIKFGFCTFQMKCLGKISNEITVWQEKVNFPAFDEEHNLKHDVMSLYRI